MSILIWAGIVLCVCQSAMLSGLNLACFSISKLELQIEAKKKNRQARRVLSLREDANFLLVTILWANVAVNVLLALLSGSVLSGLAAFLFSTVIITVFGEIVPQAYFSRHALRIGSLLAPVLRFYQIVLFPIAKPAALVLDRWLGPEGIRYFRERDIRELIKLHMESSDSEIQKVEGQGALNFLALDDVPLEAEGEPVDPESIVALIFEQDRPVFPEVKPVTSHEFLRRVHASGKKWVVIVDQNDDPRLVMNADEFVRDALFGSGRFNPYRHLHRPIVERRGRTTIGDVLPRLKVRPLHGQDDVVDDDVILLWGEHGDHRRIITGADVLGRLLRRIVENPADGELRAR